MIMRRVEKVASMLPWCVVIVVMLVSYSSVHAARTDHIMDARWDDLALEMDKLMDGVLDPSDDPYVPIPYPITDWCSAWLHKFAAVSARFINCAVKHARPFRFCRNCFEEYINAHNFLSELIHQDHKLPEKKRCFAKLVNSDIINIVGKVRDFMEYVWHDSFCQSCFDHYQFENGTLIGELTNMTREYMNQYNITNTCLTSFIHYKNATKQYDETACFDCEDDYRTLNNMYVNMKKNGSVCMDVTDAMNYTRYLWSKDFQCNIQDPNMIGVYGTCSGLCALPILFYVISKFQGKIRKRRLMKLKRLNLRKGPAHAGLLRSASLVFSDRGHVTRRPSVARRLNITPIEQIDEPNFNYQ